MTQNRAGVDNEKIEVELAALARSYFDNGDSDAEYDDADFLRYINEHASQEALLAIQEANEAHEWAEKQGVLI